MNLKTWLLERPFVYNLVTNVLSGAYDGLDRVVRSETAGSYGKVVFEIACGTGHFCPVLENARYCGLDINFEYVRSAGMQHKAGRFLCGDAKRLPLVARSVDTVLFVGFFHHVDDSFAQQVFQEVKRVLKKDGKILVVDAIWPTKWYNIVGGLLRYADRGKHVRTYRGYKSLFNRMGIQCEKSYAFSYGMSLECGVFILRNCGAGTR